MTSGSPHLRVFALPLDSAALQQIQLPLKIVSYRLGCLRLPAWIQGLLHEIVMRAKVAERDIYRLVSCVLLIFHHRGVNTVVKSFVCSCFLWGTFPNESWVN